MQQHGRALKVWIDITGTVLPVLVMLSVVLTWSAVAQIALMALSVGSVFGTQVAFSNGKRWSASRRARRRRRAERGRTGLCGRLRV